MIYFIGCASTNSVKIGTTTASAERRMSQMAPYSPVKLELLGTAEGGFHTEQALHAEFKELRLHNEWFRMDGELRALIRRLVVDGPASISDYLAELRGRRAGHRHGFISEYLGGRCRCTECVIAWQAYQKKYRGDIASDSCSTCLSGLKTEWRPGRRGRPPKCATCRAIAVELEQPTPDKGVYRVSR